MTLVEDLERIAEAAAGHGPVEAVLAAEVSDTRLYLVALGGDERKWLVLDDTGAPVDERTRVRDTASIVAMAEVVGELVDDEPPRLASPAYLDENGDPSFADSIRGASGAVNDFVADVERGYLLPLR